MQIQLFGTLRVTLHDKDIPFRSDKIRALLAYLVVENRPIPRPQLAALLWGDQPDQTARTNLRISLSRLRKSLGNAAEHLQATRQTVSLTLPPESVDFHQFDALIGQKDQLENAVAHYDGHFLADFVVEDSAEFTTWQQQIATAQHDKAMAAFDSLIASAITQQDWPAALQSTEQQLALEPWRELAHQQRMRAMVGDGERAAALAQFDRCVEVLDRELGVAVSAETQQLFEQIQNQRPKQSVANNLPAATTPFIGREPESAELRNLIKQGDYRLITLVGLGGSGKTRLALEVARSCDFADGVWFVSLAELSSGKQLASAIATALSLPLLDSVPTDQQLLRYLKNKRLLLLIDNLEHVIDDSIDLLLSILDQAADVTLFVTSRHALHVRAETLVELEGLPYPFAPQAPAEEFAAVQLFETEAKRLWKAFELAPRRAAVVEICQLVEGLPLGIELAATQVMNAPCSQIASAIRDNLASLSTRMRDVPERQRSLRAVFDYSWDLLTEPLRVLLTECAVFRGQFEWEALQAIVPNATRDNLNELVQQSLLRMVGVDRFDLHPLVREFSAENRHPDSDITLRHAAYFLQKAQALVADWLTVAAVQARQTAERDWAEFNTAWQVAIDQQAWELLAVGVVGMRDLYRFLVRYHDGLALFQDSYAALQTQAQTPAHERVLGWIDAARLWFAVQLRDHVSAETILSVALNRLDDVDDPVIAADLLISQQILLTQQDKHDASSALGEQMITLAAEHDMPALAAHARLDTGFVLLLKGKFADARILFEQAMATFEASGDLLNQTTTYRNLGIADMLLGKLNSAEAHIDAGITLARRREDKERELFVSALYTNIYTSSGDLSKSLQIAHSRLAYSKEMGLLADEATTSHNLSAIYADLGNYTAAEKLVKDVLPLIVTAERPSAYAQSLLHYANILRLQNKLTDALQVAEQALAIAAETNVPLVLGYTHNSLGSVLAAQEKLAEAAYHFQRVLAICEEDTVHIRAQLSLAQIAHAQQDKAQTKQLIEQVLVYKQISLEKSYELRYKAAKLLFEYDDARAPELLQTAYKDMLSTANKISDAALRNDFLNNIAVNNALAAAYKQRFSA